MESVVVIMPAVLAKLCSDISIGKQFISSWLMGSNITEELLDITSDMLGNAVCGCIAVRSVHGRETISAQGADQVMADAGPSIHNDFCFHNGLTVASRADGFLSRLDN